MTVFNLGSINVDYFYSVPHMIAPGETLSSTAMTKGLGGKGANQSVAAARAGSNVVHIGAIGRDSDWIFETLRGYGVDTTHIAVTDAATGHAVIMVEPEHGENAILLHAGANHVQSVTAIDDALATGGAGDYLLLQNETTDQVAAAKAAHARGMNVVYSAAPFDAEAVKQVLPYLSYLLLNRVEYDQLCAALGEVSVPNLIITLGGDGARWQMADGTTINQPAFHVTPVDTTGAGDCFAGSLIAALDAGQDPQPALEFAAAAAALQVTKHGTADAMPTGDQTRAFLKDR
ncbi:ribokinase [Rhodovulum sp. FJ3]|uniref:ribokinase n=1 Tax=Rhodovulum sp. FJ3 TaxID=3079053 RepID=UPI00293DE281|nr:ribokinase [Rhodovulum sp. FJ3]MDV4169172.1 ribokinase [Rhodovulum sp. FJ3]